VFDALISGESSFAELPAVLAGLADGTIPALCHLISYTGLTGSSSTPDSRTTDSGE
jgi:hypothetical protein